MKNQDSRQKLVDDSIDLDQVLQDIGQKDGGQVKDGKSDSLVNPGSEIASLQTTTLNHNNSRPNLQNLPNTKSESLLDTVPEVGKTKEFAVA